MALAAQGSARDFAGATFSVVSTTGRPDRTAVETSSATILPNIAGFVVTASWGEDDTGGVALTYKNVFGDFKVLGKVGYEQSSDESSTKCSSIPDQDCQWWGAAGTIMHVPTGLYVYGGFGQNHDSTEEDFNPLADANDKMWFIQAGIEQRFISAWNDDHLRRLSS